MSDYLNHFLNLFGRLTVNKTTNTPSIDDLESSEENSAALIARQQPVTFATPSFLYGTRIVTGFDMELPSLPQFNATSGQDYRFSHNSLNGGRSYIYPVGPGMARPVNKRVTTLASLTLTNLQGQTKGNLVSGTTVPIDVLDLASSVPRVDGVNLLYPEALFYYSTLDSIGATPVQPGYLQVRDAGQNSGDMELIWATGFNRSLPIGYKKLRYYAFAHHDVNLIYPGITPHPVNAYINSTDRLFIKSTADTNRLAWHYWFSPKKSLLFENCVYAVLDTETGANPAFLISGKRCFDPRTSTTVHTNNPIICLRDWLLEPEGGGLSSGNLVDSTFISAANIVDSLGTVADYKVDKNIDFDFGVAHFLAGLPFSLQESGGNYSLIDTGGTLPAPSSVKSFVKTDFLEKINFNPSNSIYDVPAALTLWYPDATYTGVLSVTVTEADVGYPLPTNTSNITRPTLYLALTTVSNVTVATNIAKRSLKYVLENFVIDITVPLSNILLEPGDTVDITLDDLNWTAKKFVILEKAVVLYPDTKIRLKLKSNPDSIYA